MKPFDIFIAYMSWGMSFSAAVNLFLTQSVIQRRLPIDNVIAEPLGEPPGDDEYHSFESWEQAKAWVGTVRNKPNVLSSRG